MTNPGRVAESLVGQFLGVGPEDIHLAPVGPRRTGESTCSSFCSATGERYVLKQFRSSPYASPAEVAAREYSALDAFCSALNVDGLGVPTPLRLFENAGAYIMSYHEGRLLPGALVSGAVDVDSVGIRLARGLAVFERAVGTPYGDFHPENIIVGADGHLWLIDPCLPDPFFAEISRGLLPTAADCGYWSYSVAVKSLRQMLRGPAKPWALVIQTRSLVSAAADLVDERERDRFLQEVWSTMGAHLDRLAERAALGDKVLAAWGRTVRPLLFSRHSAVL